LDAFFGELTIRALHPDVYVLLNVPFIDLATDRISTEGPHDVAGKERGYRCHDAQNDDTLDERVDHYVERKLANSATLREEDTHRLHMPVHDMDVSPRIGLVVVERGPVCDCAISRHVAIRITLHPCTETRPS